MRSHISPLVFYLSPCQSLIRSIGPRTLKPSMSTFGDFEATSSIHQSTSIARISPLLWGRSGSPDRCRRERAYLSWWGDDWVNPIILAGVTVGPGTETLGPFSRVSLSTGWQCGSRGSTRKMSFFQIASGPILSIPIYSKTCLYGPCKFLLKKMTPSLPTNPPKSAFFCISDWTSDSVGFTSEWPFTGFFTKD